MRARNYNVEVCTFTCLATLGGNPPQKNPNPNQKPTNQPRKTKPAKKPNKKHKKTPKTTYHQTQQQQKGENTHTENLKQTKKTDKIPQTDEQTCKPTQPKPNTSPPASTSIRKLNVGHPSLSLSVKIPLTMATKCPITLAETILGWERLVENTDVLM